MPLAGLEKKMKNSIQRLSPMVFMGSNKEEIYKTLVVLYREIEDANDLPQVHISLDRQTDKEIIFRIHLVQIAPAYSISWNNLFLDCFFASEHMSTLKKIKNHAIQAHIFRLHFPRDYKLLRSDGSLIFYAAGKKVVFALTKALGEFRDFNGGIFYEQQELFQKFKQDFSTIAQTESELMETFFYSLIPEEKQIFLRKKILSTFFTLFLRKREEILPTNVSIPFRSIEPMVLGFKIRVFWGMNPFLFLFMEPYCQLLKKLYSRHCKRRFVKHKIRSTIF